MSAQIGIKVPRDSSIVKVAQTVKDIEPVPVTEIRRRVKDFDYLLTYNTSDEQGFKNIIRCYKVLVKQGIEPVLFEHDRQTDIDFICNLSESYRVISAEIDEEPDFEKISEDANKVFEYKLFNAWNFPYLSLSVFDRSEDNVKCIVWYATEAPAGLPFVSNYSLDEGIIRKIGEIICENQAVFRIKEIEFPPVLDGFGNEFFFKHGDKSTRLEAWNIAYWNKCKKTIDGNRPVNARLLLKMFSQIRKVLTDNGVDERYLSLVWE